jgi:hypothetical protein
MEAGFVVWTAEACPAVVTLIGDHDRQAGRAHATVNPKLGPVLVQEGQDRLIERMGARFQIRIDPTAQEPIAVKLPFDRLFDIRAAAATRLWRALSDRNPGPDPALPSRQRRDRLIQALRALDGRLAGASYRDVAVTVFGRAIEGPAWKTHDLRDRTIRAVRYGQSLMQGGYRQLLLYPYRRSA